MATESGGDETGDETGGPRDETGDKTAATAGDERDGGDRWGNVCGRRSVYNQRPPSLFGEHCEILRRRTLRKTLKIWWGRLEKRRKAALEGQSLVAEFTRCTRWPGQPFIIDPVTNAVNVKKALCI